MKVLHILYQSLPQISGSSIRSRDILMSQQAFGLEVLAITSPFQNAEEVKETLNGVPYYRTAIHNKDSISDLGKPVYQRILRLFKIRSFYSAIKRIIEKERPAILHAHAMFFCGLPAVRLGKKFNIPVVYEVRSLWMLNKQDTKTGWVKRVIEKLLFKLELYVMHKATVVIAINERLKTTLVENGIAEDKIRLVKNAVNTELIDILKNKIVDNTISTEEHFGYIGTLTPHEGIDMLIRAFSEVRKKHTEAKLFIYGSGIESSKIKTMTEKQAGVMFLGPVNPIEIHNAFSKIGIVVNPRYKNKLTDAVTPLKPLEAMAYEKIFIGSDVGGILELVTDNYNGFLFPAGNEIALAERMCQVIQMEKAKKKQVIAQALGYVVANRSWITNAEYYAKIYNTIAKC